MIKGNFPHTKVRHQGANSAMPLTLNTNIKLTGYAIDLAEYMSFIRMQGASFTWKTEQSHQYSYTPKLVIGVDHAWWGELGTFGAHPRLMDQKWSTPSA